MIRMWSYFGSKANIIRNYPKPKKDLPIYEPFAGTGRYALEYWWHEIILIDKYPVVIDVYQWLQSCSPKDILSLPRTVKSGQRIDEMKWSCDAERDFYGFIVGCGSERPRMKATDRKTTQRPNHINYNLQRIAKNLFKIKEWKIVLGEYTDAPDLEANWFIDPPYQHGGAAYIMSNKKINFAELGPWCESRKGLVIVCENTKADWMNFKPIVKQRGSLKVTTEAIWCNEPTAYDMQQQKLF